MSKQHRNTDLPVPLPNSYWVIKQNHHWQFLTILWVPDKAKSVRLKSLRWKQRYCPVGNARWDNLKGALWRAEFGYLFVFLYRDKERIPPKVEITNQANSFSCTLTGTYGWSGICSLSWREPNDVQGPFLTILLYSSLFALVGMPILLGVCTWLGQPDSNATDLEESIELYLEIDTSLDAWPAWLFIAGIILSQISLLIIPVRTTHERPKPRRGICHGHCCHVLFFRTGRIFPLCWTNPKKKTGSLR